MMIISVVIGCCFYYYYGGRSSSRELWTHNDDDDDETINATSVCRRLKIRCDLSKKSRDGATSFDSTTFDSNR